MEEVSCWRHWEQLVCAGVAEDRSIEEVRWSGQAVEGEGTPDDNGCEAVLTAKGVLSSEAGNVCEIASSTDTRAIGRLELPRVPKL